MGGETTALETQARFLHVPIEAVFEALTEPVQLRFWRGLHSVIDARLGGTFEITDDDGTVHRGSITTMRRPDRLAVRFEQDVVVDVKLSPSLGGTHVQLLATDAGLWGDALARMEAAFGQPDRW